VAPVSDRIAPGDGEDLLATAQAGPVAARGGVLRVAGYGFGAALSVVSAALMFRHLGVRDSGRFVTVSTLVVLFVGLTEAGLWTITVRELSASADRRAALIMRDVVGLRLALSITAALAAVGFAAIAGYAPVMVAGAALFAFAMVIQNVQQTWSAALAARLRFGWITSLDLIRQLVNVAGVVVLVLASGGLLAFLALAIPAAIATLLPTGLLVRRDVPLSPRFDVGVWRRLLRDVLPFAAATAVAALYFRVSLIIVSLIADERQTGWFAASFRVVEVLVAVPALIVSTALPIFARAAGGDLARLRFGVQRVVDTTTIFGAAIVLAVFVGAPDVIAVIGGSRFAPAAEVLQIQCVGLLATFVSTAWGYVLLSLGRYRSILLLVCGPLVLNVVLTLVLAPAYGAAGAAVATTVGELALAIVGAVMVNRAIAPHELAPWPVVRAIALAVPLGALALLSAIPAFALGALASGVYLVAIWALGWLPADLLKDVLGRGG
jgi:O-antigen/teichoic acid export membrane protein